MQGLSDVPTDFKKTMGGTTSSIAPKKVREQPVVPNAGAYKIQHNPRPSEFRRFYDRGDLPMCTDFAGATRKVHRHPPQDHGMEELWLFDEGDNTHSLCQAKRACLHHMTV